MRVWPVLGMAAIAVLGSGAILLASRPPGPASGGPPPATFRAMADDAVRTLRERWYAGSGQWRACVDAACGARNVDWAADSLTGILAERWMLARDAAVLPLLRELEVTEPHYAECRRPTCAEWSDVPMWDAVAAVRSYDATRDAAALRNAEAAYRFVARSDVFARGACPEIDYQRPRAESGGLKTLETDANATLAAALLFERTRKREYLDDAKRRYAAIRTWFLDRSVPLYTVYVFDDGATCRALPHRFFASVNGLMIDAGATLARATGDARYAQQARATARALRFLDDARGIFADLQAENDVVEPLVIAMLGLARDGDAYARSWILRNAAAAAHARRADGSYGRFFDGPPPAGPVTAWQTNGGLALAVAAGALAPSGRPERNDPWRSAPPARVTIDALPSTFRFTGSGIALIGTIG